jgi:hypothetical protein
MSGRQRAVNVLSKRQQQLNKETATGQAGVNKMPELVSCAEARSNSKCRGNIWSNLGQHLIIYYYYYYYYYYYL